MPLAMHGFQAMMLDEFSALFLEFLDSRAATLGAEGGGLYDFYLRRLKLRRALLNSEDLAATTILNELPRYASYVEIGCGFGQLCSLLAINRLTVSAIECDAARFSGLDELRTLVASRWPEAQSRLTAVMSRFPCPLPGTIPAVSLVITTNLIHGTSFEAEQAIIDGMSAYAAALVDTLRFCRDRTTAEDWAELDARFDGAGLAKHRIFGTAVGERLVWYVRQPPGRRSPGPG
jgi:hypothetical protein